MSLVNSLFSTYLRWVVTFNFNIRILKEIKSWNEIIPLLIIPITIYSLIIQGLGSEVKNIIPFANLYRRDCLVKKLS